MKDPGPRHRFHFSPSIFHFAVPTALLFLALHLPFLPQSLEDADSINFALGAHRFDVARHQPHPPGYPLFIVLVKGVRTFAATDARAGHVRAPVASHAPALDLWTHVRRAWDLLVDRAATLR